MPSRKQRRRQQKLRRHEWEEVLVDEEGNEVVLEPGERNNKEKKPDRRAAASRGGRRPVREVQPPSWRRVGKRGALFAPLMFVVVYLISGDEISLASKLLQTLFLLAFFLPFSYVMDTVAYRAYRRRLERS
jgi:hypothetical protein